MDAILGSTWDVTGTEGSSPGENEPNDPSKSAGLAEGPGHYPEYTL